MLSKVTNGKIVAKNYDSRLYHQQEAKRGDSNYVMSRSELVEFVRCPSRWRRGYKENEEGSDAMDFGSLVDAILFDPSRVEERFAIKPETYPSDDGPKKFIGTSKWCKAWLEKNSDRICVKQEDFDSGVTAVARIKDDEAAANIIQGADFQVYITAEYHDASTGVVVPIKTLIDIVPHHPEFVRSIAELKTARDANPARWGRTVNSMGYHVQGAMFIDSYNAATNEERFEFRTICQENYAPFEISKPLLSDEFLNMGRSRYLAALRLYAQCIKSNTWPGYDDLQEVCLSGWALVQPDAYMLGDSVSNWEPPQPERPKKQLSEEDSLH